MNKTNIIPPFLKQGDKVAIIATARKITIDEIQPAIDLLKSWGLIPIIGNSIGTQHFQFADTDQQRATDLQFFLDAPDIKAIWCARGGYGTARIIDQLSWQAFCTYPKWVIGYSDITALQAHIWQQTKIATIHASIPVNIIGNTPQAIESLRLTLFGNIPSYTLNAHQLNRQGTCKGTLIGGNLSVLYSIIGTKSALQAQNGILFIEDLDEYLYHIDRMMLSLYRSGFLAKLKGLVVGAMSDMKDNNIPFGSNAYEIIAQYVRNYDFPVLFDFPAGHIPNNNAIVIGKPYKLQIDTQKAILSPFH